jgi:hypothetical protein
MRGRRAVRYCIKQMRCRPRARVAGGIPARRGGAISQVATQIALRTGINVATGSIAAK